VTYLFFPISYYLLYLVVFLKFTVELYSILGNINFYLRIHMLSSLLVVFLVFPETWCRRTSPAYWNVHFWWFFFSWANFIHHRNEHILSSWMAKWLNFWNNEEFESGNKLKTEKIENLEFFWKKKNGFFLNFKIQKIVLGLINFCVWNFRHTKTLQPTAHVKYSHFKSDQFISIKTFIENVHSIHTQRAEAFCSLVFSPLWWIENTANSL
jgi:hypothetical protein